MVITPVYAGLLAIIYVALSFRVIRLRRAVQIALGDGDDRALMRRMRVHANFSEYVPPTVLLMAFAEVQNAPHWLVYFVGTALLVGGSLHAYGVSGEPETLAFRLVGMSLTFTALILGALINLVLPIIAL